MCGVKLGKKLGFLSIHFLLLLSPSLFIFIPQIITMSRTTQNSRSQIRSNQFVCNKKEEEHVHSFVYICGLCIEKTSKETVLRTVTTEIAMTEAVIILSGL
jgi:hypothetical protein